MKVLLIDVNCKNSSTGKIVFDLYTKLNLDGHTAAICYGRGAVIQAPNIYKFGLDWETMLHAGLSRITGLNGYFSYFSTLRLIKFIEEFQPDVIHLHELHAYFLNIRTFLNYLKNNNIKTVHTLHSEFTYTGKCGHSKDCNKWQNECKSCPLINEYPRSFFFDFTKTMFKHKRDCFQDFDNLIVTVPSNWLANRVRLSFLKKKKLIVLNNGIDTSIFYPRDIDHLRAKHNFKNEKIILAVAPNLMSNSKGGKYVIELAKEMKDENVKFILIGVKHSTYKYPKNVITLGRTNNQVELAEYYSMANVFVICSERENYPTVCLEAICCGTPVVGFNEGGTSETAPPEYGSFVPYGDLDMLKKSVKFFFEFDSMKRIQCAKYGALTFDKKIMYEKYLKLYEEFNDNN